MGGQTFQVCPFIILKRVSLTIHITVGDRISLKSAYGDLMLSDGETETHQSMGRVILGPLYILVAQ